MTCRFAKKVRARDGAVAALTPPRRVILWWNVLAEDRINGLPFRFYGCYGVPIPECAQVKSSRCGSARIRRTTISNMILWRIWHEQGGGYGNANTLEAGYAIYGGFTVMPTLLEDN